jgi:hypothetical protein
MKTLYQAANAIEAHMLSEMLRQQGIAAQVLGEHLQGGVGELPAAGLIRLVVDEQDYSAARAVVEQWDAEQPRDLPALRPAPAGAQGLAGFVAGVLVGLLLGWHFWAQG